MFFFRNDTAQTMPRLIMVIPMVEVLNHLCANGRASQALVESKLTLADMSTRSRIF